MIKVDVGAPSAPTPQQLAESFANSAGGSISSEERILDGSPAAVATTPSSDLSKPQTMIIVYREGKAYLLMASAVQGNDINDAISQVCLSWKWTNPSAQ